MFGKKKENEVLKVPVYTLHTLPRNFEPITLVYASSEKKDELFKLLSDSAASIGADAVIGLFIHSRSVSPILDGYGTAIRFVD